MKPNAIDIVCERCGSHNCGRDATARWNATTQAWELATVHDAAFCDDCNVSETTLKEIPLD